MARIATDSHGWTCSQCCLHGLRATGAERNPCLPRSRKKDFIRGYFRFAMRNVLVVSILSSILLFGISFLLHKPADDLLRKSLWIAVPVLPVAALINLRLSWLRSFQFNALSQIPDKVIRPVIFLGHCWYSFSFQKWIGCLMVILMSAGSILVALPVVIFSSGKKLRARWRNSTGLR